MPKESPVGYVVNGIVFEERDLPILKMAVESMEEQIKERDGRRK
jgi:hypothetical protein